MSALSPFSLVETLPGHFSLLLTTFAPANQVFEDLGALGGGYDWAGLAECLLQQHDPALRARLSFDPEGSMFCAYGPDRDALEQLGVRLAALFHDPLALRAAVQAALQADMLD